eukprot:scaffold1484_cov241-Pinguiococcus_pyrenoidosus.AAC.1
MSLSPRTTTSSPLAPKASFNICCSSAAEASKGTAAASTLGFEGSKRRKVPPEAETSRNCTSLEIPRAISVTSTARPSPRAPLVSIWSRGRSPGVDREAKVTSQAFAPLYASSVAYAASRSSAALTETFRMPAKASKLLSSSSLDASTAIGAVV